MRNSIESNDTYLGLSFFQLAFSTLSSLHLRDVLGLLYFDPLPNITKEFA